MTSFCQTLEKESESVLEWFKNNSMIANLDKFQAIILRKSTTDVACRLTIYDNEKLLGVEIDYQFKFIELISTLCSKAVM